MGGGGQHQRPGQPEVGEQQLPLLPEGGPAPVVPHPQLHVPQGQPLELGAAGIVRLQRHQGPPEGRDGVPHPPGQGVALPGGAGAGIGRPPGGQHHRPELGQPAALLRRHLSQPSVLRRQARQTVPAQVHPLAAQLKKQGVHNVRRPVGHGEHPLPPLRFQRHPQALKKVHGVLGGEAAKRAEQKPPVPGDGGQQLVPAAVVGEVTAALSGDIQLPAHLLVGLQQHHVRPGPGGGNGGHHPRRPAPGHNHPIAVSHTPPSHRPGTRPRSAPGC